MLMWTPMLGVHFHVWLMCRKLWWGCLWWTSITRSPACCSHFRPGCRIDSWTFGSSYLHHVTIKTVIRNKVLVKTVWPPVISLLQLRSILLWVKSRQRRAWIQGRAAGSLESEISFSQTTSATSLPRTKMKRTTIRLRNFRVIDHCSPMVFLERHIILNNFHLVSNTNFIKKKCF